MAVQKDRIARRVVLWTAALSLVWLFGVWPPPVWWRTHEPRCTAMMRLRDACSAQAAALAATLPQPHTSNPAFRPARMVARRDLILARYYGGKTPVPPALEDSIPEIPPIEPPILPPILDTLVVPDTLVIPDTTRDHPDSGGPIDH